MKKNQISIFVFERKKPEDEKRLQIKNWEDYQYVKILEDMTFQSFM